MNLRKYRESDAEELVLLFTSSVHVLSIGHYDSSQRDAWAPKSPNIAEWRKRFEGVHTIVAEDDASCLGFISYEADGHVDLLYTKPNAARKGVASALLAEAILQLRTLGVKELYTEASLVAVPFFSHHGFKITEEQNIIRHGVKFQRFAMRM
ncbi:MAG: GNAT family N-acetyltransferase [Gammaproteobacteria bacterium]|nr:GNAT family N-acetyltransferase [Gammaproteobacteria bacterium]